MSEVIPGGKMPPSVVWSDDERKPTAHIGAMLVFDGSAYSDDVSTGWMGYCNILRKSYMHRDTLLELKRDVTEDLVAWFAQCGFELYPYPTTQYIILKAT